MINNKPIQKELYKQPILNKYLLGYMVKLSHKAKKMDEDLLLTLFLKANDKAKMIINHELIKKAEQRKQEAIENFIDKSREKGEWIYLASSHDDCAEDHKDYQARLYVDEKAPDDIIEWAHSKGLYTVQWVMGKPVWFITRPNCRHYFISLPLDKVKNKSVKKLVKKYKTHSIEGNYELQTPRKLVIAEYEDRLKMLRALYREHQSQPLKNKILKTELLVEKWKDYHYNKSRL